MALRNLVTRMRVPASTALRRPRLSPAAGCSPLSSTPQGVYFRVPTPGVESALDQKVLESASADELLSKAEAFNEEYARTMMGPMRELEHEMGQLEQEAFSLAKKYVCTSVGICLLGWVSAYWGSKYPVHLFDY